MPWGMRYEGTAGQILGDTIPRGQDLGWLKDFYPEYADGRGMAEWTTDPLKAKRFERAGDVLTLWMSVPVARAVRPDGKPNRPLTAYHVSPQALPGVE